MTTSIKTNFPELIEQLDAGVIAKVLGLAVSNVALGAHLSGRKGKVTLHIDVNPVGTNNEIAELGIKIDIKEPKTGKGFRNEDFHYQSMGFIGKGGVVTYDRPKEEPTGQMTLDTTDKKLKEVR